METLSGVGVLDKAVAVIEAVRTGAGTLPELVAATGQPRATVHRLAAALTAHGWLRRADDGRYELGLGLISLGRLAAEAFPLGTVARPELTQLRDITGESTQLFVSEAGGRRCVVSLESAHGLRWIVPEGALFPAHVGSAGRLLDGQVGAAGWTESVEEREPGVASVSAPVIGPDGRIVAAVSVSGPVERLGPSPGVRFGADVVAAGTAIASRLQSFGRRRGHSVTT